MSIATMVSLTHLGRKGLKGLTLSTYLPVSEYFLAFDSFSPRFTDLPMACSCAMDDLLHFYHDLLLISIATFFQFLIQLIEQEICMVTYHNYL